VIQQILTVTFLTGFLAATLRMAVPILITALGEMVAERSGVMNLGIEGIMIMGAFSAFAVAYQTGNLWLGLLCGGLTGLLFGLAMGIAAVRFSANQIVAGLGIWIFCQGLASLLNRHSFAQAPEGTLPTFAPVPIPGLSQLPILGDALFNQNILVYVTLLLVPVAAFFFARMRWGLNVDAVGENPRAADAAGLRVGAIRLLATTFGGLMAGLGGAYLALALYGLYTDDLSTGLGWMAIAVVVFGKWRPAGLLAGALIFGASKGLQFRLQAM
jgi:general nucleoside transport system permease protein